MRWCIIFPSFFLELFHGYAFISIAKFSLNGSIFQSNYKHGRVELNRSFDKFELKWMTWKYALQTSMSMWMFVMSKSYWFIFRIPRKLDDETGAFEAIHAQSHRKEMCRKWGTRYQGNSVGLASAENNKNKRIFLGGGFKALGEKLYPRERQCGDCTVQLAH